MNSLMAFLVTLGILNVSDGKDLVTVEQPPAVVAQAADVRAERIRLTNDWLRSMRQVKRHGYEPVRPITVASAD